MRCLQSSFSFFDLCRIATLLSIVLLLVGNVFGQPTKNDEQPQVEKGKITLSIGDGFVFGEADPRSDEDRSNLDFYIQDIRHGASLAALAGCTVPAQPMTSAGLPKEPSQLFGMLKDSPTDLPKRDLWLLPECTSQRLGIGLIKSRSGKVYKLCLLKIDGHPEALKRTVQIAYESVSMVEGGGVLQLPEAKGQPDQETTASIRDALNVGALIPGDTFSRYIAGDYVAFETLHDNTVIEDGAYIALTKELNSSIKLENRGSVFAGKGMEPEGSVFLDAYGAIGVLGPMRGRIYIESYGYIYIDGAMEGTLNLDSYCTVVLKQGLSGTVRVRSYADMLIKGPITGTIDADGSCWSTLYFDGEYSRAALADMSSPDGDFDQITLHVRESDDLAVGEHKNVGTWRKVIVGDQIWNKLK